MIITEKNEVKNNTALSFKNQRKEALDRAKKNGIIDVVTGGYSGKNIDIKTVNLANELMEKHGTALYEIINERRKSQK